MNSAKRIIDTVNRVLLMSGLEIMSSPEFNAYAANKSDRQTKAMKIEALRFAVCKDVLEKELNSPELAQSKDALTAVRLAQLLQVAKYAPGNFIPALKKIAEVFQEIPFAEYCQREQEMYMEQRQSIAPAKRSLLTLN